MALQSFCIQIGAGKQSSVVGRPWSERQREEHVPDLAPGSEPAFNFELPEVIGAKFGLDGNGARLDSELQNGQIPAYRHQNLVLIAPELVGFIGIEEGEFLKALS